MNVLVKKRNSKPNIKYYYLLVYREPDLVIQSEWFIIYRVQNKSAAFMMPPVVDRGTDPIRNMQIMGIS